MTEVTAGTAQKLQVVSSVVNAYRNVLGRPVAVVRIAALPGAVSAAITYTIASSPLWGRAWVLMAFLLLIIPLVYLAQVWLRHRLLNETKLLRVTGHRLECYARLFSLGAALVIWLLCIPFCAVVAGALLFLELAEEPWIYVPYLREGLFPLLLWIGLVALFALPAGRFFLFAPAVAIGQSQSLRTLWRSTRDHGLRISLAWILLFLTFAIVEFVLLLTAFLVAAALDDLLGNNSFEALRNASAFATLLIGTLVGTILSAELLAVTFRDVTGWKGPEGDILERFD